MGTLGALVNQEQDRWLKYLWELYMPTYCFMTRDVVTGIFFFALLPKFLDMEFAVVLFLACMGFFC